MMATQNYYVDLQRADDANTVNASVRKFTLTVGSKARDMSVGLNPVETLLSAAGACMTSSLGLVAKNSNVEINGVRMHAVGTRQDDPPASDDKLESIVRVASKATTVVSTLPEALDVSIEWKRSAGEQGG